MLRNIYMPTWFYKWAPLWCIIWATAGWFATLTWYSVLSSIFLYMWAGFAIYKRYIE